MSFQRKLHIRAAALASDVLRAAKELFIKPNDKDSSAAEVTKSEKPFALTAPFLAFGIQIFDLWSLRQKILRFHFLSGTLPHEKK